VATWGDFESAEPEMAALGIRQLQKFGLAFLGTVRPDGAPRVHPVCPFVARGRLFVATSADSPKRLDLLRDGRYALHLLPGQRDEEFLLRGRAHRVDDRDYRAAVVAEAPPQPDGNKLNIRPDEWLFEYDIEEVRTTHWENFGRPDIRPLRDRWPRPASRKSR
jgi:hypothetical protein